MEDVTDIFDGTHQTPQYTDFGVKFVSVENIATLESKKYISQDAYEKEYSSKKAKKGDILMTRIGDIGTARAIEKDEPLAYYVTLALLKPKEIDSNFLVWLIASPEVQHNIWKRTLHIAFPKKINLGEISQIEMMVPRIEEQTKIGAFFKELNHFITLHQRKLDLLKRMKQGFLQQIFPEQGAKIPRLRFADFEGNWEQRKLGEILEERSTMSEKSDIYPLVSFTVERGVTAKTERYEREQLVKGDKQAKKYKVTKYNDIVYNPANLKFGAISRNKYGQAVFSPIYVTFEVNKKFAMPEYMERVVTRKNFIKFSLKFQQGTVYERQAVSPEDLQRLNISIPKKIEQKVIGEFFDDLDTIITLYHRKLGAANKLKEFYLQKMFI